MKYRNSSRNSMHLLNGVMVGGDDAHTAGVEIYPAASRSIPTIEAVAAATTQTLRIAGKGSRGVIVGAAGGSPIVGAYSSFTMAWELATVSSGQLDEIVIGSSVAGIMPGDIVSINHDLVAPLISGGLRFSTAAASRVTMIVANPGSSASATQSG